MGPIKIKYYGMFWITRRAYLLTTAVAAGFALVALLAAGALGSLPPFRWPWDPPLPLRVGGPFAWLANNFYPFIAVCVVAELIDILVVLRRFAQKEAEQKAELDALDTEGFAHKPSLVPPGRVHPAPGYQEPPRSDTDYTTH